MLDHSSYPGLVDAIVAVAPFESLLALRTASRAFRACADAQLTRHLICDWYLVGCAIHGGVHRHPAFWGLCTQPQIPRPGGYYNLPSPLGDAALLGDWVGSASQQQDSRRGSCGELEDSNGTKCPGPGGRRVIDALDISGPQSIYPLLLLTTRLRPALVRLWVCGTPTQVDAPLALDTETIVVMGCPRGPAGPLSVHEEPPLLLTTSVRRVVYHLKPGYAANAALFRQIERHAAQLGQPRPNEEVREGSDTFDLVVIVSGPVNRRAGFLLWEIVHLGRANPHIPITVVNPPQTQMDSYYPGPVSSQSLAQRCPTFREWARAVVMRDRGLEVFQDQWRFYSFDEYARVVGARQYALEMGEMV